MNQVRACARVWVRALRATRRWICQGASGAAAASAESQLNSARERTAALHAYCTGRRGSRDADGLYLCFPRNARGRMVAGASVNCA